MLPSVTQQTSKPTVNLCFLGKSGYASNAVEDSERTAICLPERGVPARDGKFTRYQSRGSGFTGQ